MCIFIDIPDGSTAYVVACVYQQWNIRDSQTVLDFVSGISSPSEKEGRKPHLSGSGSQGTGQPVIHIHHHYRQIGNCNQMLVNPAGTDYLKQGQLSRDNSLDSENDSYEDPEESDMDYESNCEYSPEFQRSTTVWKWANLHRGSIYCLWRVSLLTCRY